MKKNIKENKRKKAFGHIFLTTTVKFTPIEITWEELAKNIKNPRGKYRRQGQQIKIKIENRILPAELIGFHYPNGDKSKPPLFAFLIIDGNKKVIKIGLSSYRNNWIALLAILFFKIQKKTATSAVHDMILSKNGSSYY